MNNQEPKPHRAKKQVKDTAYATDKNGQRIYIEDAERGKKGYYCRGEDCQRELVAVKGDIKQHYFRHHALDVEYGGVCTYSNETERHKIGKEVLQRLKRIKVPNLYKAPPLGLDAKKMLIHESRVIQAHTVRNEKSFYIDNDGYLSTKESNCRHQIKPDVIFYNKQDKPILFIELVATHGITKHKFNLLKKFGIDTVQVSIPKGSPQEIEQAFVSTSRTKWVYNYEQEITDYVFISRDSGERVQDIDEDEEIVYRELVTCRRSRIKTLIRQIGKCIRSEYYQSIERQLSEELSKVEESAKRERREVDKVETGLQEQQDSFRESLEEIEREYEEECAIVKDRAREDISQRYANDREKVNLEASEIESKSKELEERYFAKRDELEDRREEARKKDRELSDAIKSDRSIRESVEETIADTKASIRTCRATRIDIEEILARSRDEDEQEEGIITGLHKDGEQSQKKIRAEFRAKERQIVDEFAKGNNELFGDSEVFRKRELISNLIQAEAEEKRLRTLIQSARARAYKTRDFN